MSGRRRKSATTPAPAGGQDPKRMRSEVLPSSSGAEKGSSSAAPATVLVRDLTVEVEERVLECIVCYLPLKPPIFQCSVGHVLCSPCSEKLKDARKCHVCGVAMADGYRRCHAMEDMLNSIRGPCPHVSYGCDATPVYHALKEHLLRCPHAPCRCLGGSDCGFVGSLTALVEHLAAAHSWPCTAEPSADDGFGVDLHDGFNFLTAVRGGAMYLLLLDMASTPFFHVISAVWIRSVPVIASTSTAPATMNTTCDLELRFRQFMRRDYQRSRFRLQCTTPLNVLPEPNASFDRFFLPKYLGGPDKATVHVTAEIFIHHKQAHESSM